MKASKVTYVDFQKKKNITEKSIYNSWYDKWINIKRACDPSKTIVHEAITYIAAIEFLFLKNPDEIIFNTKLLKKKSHHKERQRGRFLKQIADLYDIEHHTSYDYKGKKRHFVWSAKRTKNSLEILQNPELFYSKMAVKNDLDTSQKCLVYQSKMSGTYIDNRNTVEVEDIAYGYISSTEEEVSIKERNNARAQETENTTCSNAILTEHSQVAIPEPKETVTACDDTNKPKLLTSVEEKAIHLQRMQRDPNEQSEWSLSALMKKIISKQENVGVLQLEVETIPSISPIEKSVDQPKTEILSNNEEAFMKQEETNLISEKETRKMLLSKAIFDAFGTTANEIQDNCKFEETEVGKVTIKPAIGVSFNDIEKAKIRKCIKSVYGEGVVLALVNTNLYVNKEPVVTESGFARSDVLETSSQNNPQWLQFKSALTKVLLKKHEEKIALHIWKNWFDKLRVRDDTTSQKLILVGSVFTIQWIDDKFGLELENAVLASNLTIELRDEANRNRPLIFSKETIKRG